MATVYAPVFVEMELNSVYEVRIRLATRYDLRNPLSPKRSNGKEEVTRGLSWIAKFPRPGHFCFNSPTSRFCFQYLEIRFNRGVRTLISLIFVIDVVSIKRVNEP